MNKYINADKLIAEIERRMAIVEKYKDAHESAAAARQELIWTKNFIQSLQQEQPEGLEEAAEEYARPCGFAVGTIKEETTLPPNPDKLYAFKAGAEWMAGREKLPKIHGWLSKDPGDYYVHFSIDKPVFDGTYWQSNDCMLTIPEEVVPWVTPDKLAVVELLIRKK